MNMRNVREKREVRIQLRKNIMQGKKRGHENDYDDDRNHCYVN